MLEMLASRLKLSYITASYLKKQAPALQNFFLCMCSPTAAEWIATAHQALEKHTGQRGDQFPSELLRSLCPTT